MERMAEASGYEADEITSRSRRRPLPAVRWMIGRELMRYGYPGTAIARELNIDHATLLHGRKMLEVMRESRRNWRLEIEIEERFKQLITDKRNGETKGVNEPGAARP